MSRSLRIAALAAATALLAACGSSTGAQGSGSQPTGGSTTHSSPTTSTSSRPTTTTSGGATRSTSTTPSSGPGGGSVPAGFKPTSATFVDTDDGWVLGTAPCPAQPCTSIVRTRDGGATWQGIPAPKAALTLDEQAIAAQVHGIRFADQQDGWVYGRELWSTRDGGATWQQIHITAPGIGISSLESGGGYVYVATDSCNPGSGGNTACTTTTQVLAARIGSNVWHSVATLSVVSARSRDSEPLLTVEKGGWWLSLPGGIYHGVGTGAASRVAQPCASYFGGASSSQFASPDGVHQDLLCVGGPAAGTAEAQLLGSSDSGASFSRSGSTIRIPSGVAGIADNGAGVLVVAASSGSSELRRTVNDGGSYTVPLNVFTGGGSPWTDLGFTDAHRGIAVLYGMALYLSNNAGAEWSAVTF